MSQHKLLESNRPKQLMTKALIFKNNLTKKMSFGEQTPPLDTSAKLCKGLPHHHQSNKQEQVQHRLKLKDYLKLNELSRSKHHTKSKSKQSHLKSSIQISQSNFRQTFGPTRNLNIGVCQNSTIKKRSINNQQQIAQSIGVVQQQLVKTTQKAINKLNSLNDLIKKTGDQNKNYQDLVFLCKIQGLIEEKILNGIAQINKLYIDHFKLKEQDGKLCLNVKSLLKINAAEQNSSISPIKLRRNTSLKDTDNAKTIKKTQVFRSFQ